MSTRLTGPVQIAAQTLHSSSADKMHQLGELVFANDGTAFRYCKAGATALVAGKLQQSSAEDTALQNLTAVAAAIGDLSIVSTTTVTVTANEYAEGWVLVTVTPGVGRQYKVKGHIAYTTAAPTFAMFDEVKVALTTTSRLDLVRNAYSAVIVNPSAATSAPNGVAVHPVAISEFGWLQVAGVALILADGTVTVGTELDASNAVAGAVEAHNEAGVIASVGHALTGIANTEYGAVKLHGVL
jgi:hypothetical protein